MVLKLCAATLCNLSATDIPRKRMCLLAYHFRGNQRKISLLEFSKLLFLNPKWGCSCPQKDQALGILCLVSLSSLLLILFDFFLFFLILCSSFLWVSLVLSFSFKFCCPCQHHGWAFLLLLIFWLSTLVNVWHWITPTAWSWWSQWKFYGSWLHGAIGGLWTCICHCFAQTALSLFFFFSLFFVVGFPLFSCLLICCQIWNFYKPYYQVISQFYSVWFRFLVWRSSQYWGRY